LLDKDLLLRELTIRRLIAQFDQEETTAICQANNTIPPLTIAEVRESHSAWPSVRLPSFTFSDRPVDLQSTHRYLIRMDLGLDLPLPLQPFRSAG
jgi:hypothetical protein